MPVVSESIDIRLPVTLSLPRLNFRSIALDVMIEIVQPTLECTTVADVNLLRHDIAMVIRSSLTRGRIIYEVECVVNDSFLVLVPYRHHTHVDGDISHPRPWRLGLRVTFDHVSSKRGQLFTHTPPEILFDCDTGLTGRTKDLQIGNLVWVVVQVLLRLQPIAVVKELGHQSCHLINVHLRLHRN